MVSTLGSAICPLTAGTKEQLRVPADLPDSWLWLICQHLRQDWSWRLSSCVERVDVPGVLSCSKVPLQWAATL